jgi:hypothetical protein
MTLTTSPTSIRRQPQHHATCGSSCADRPRAQHERPPRRDGRPLARYSDASARPREVVAQGGSGGSVLVVDRDATTFGDRRLLAHLGADEPTENAELVCSRYLEATRGRGCRCRRLAPEDSRIAPLGDLERALRSAEAPPRLPFFEVHQPPAFAGIELPWRSAAADIPDPGALRPPGCSYRLGLLRTQLSIPELRWLAEPPPEGDREPHPASVREVIGALESYEPVRTLTLEALALYGCIGEVSTTVLRAELVRILHSPIVLNRRLRTVALATMEREGLSISEIAIRCGRVKLDRRGNESGETSWLARRLGILPEGGRKSPTPWIHSDVLGLIARRGLGISPREVEL